MSHSPLAVRYKIRTSENRERTSYYRLQGCSFGAPSSKLYDGIPNEIFKANVTPHDKSGNYILLVHPK